MRLQFQPIWHVNGARRDVVDSGEIVVAKRREIWSVAQEPAIGRSRRKRDAGRKQIGKFLEERAVVRWNSKRAVQ